MIRKSVIYFVLWFCLVGVTQSKEWQDLRAQFEQSGDSNLLLEIGRLGDVDSVSYLKSFFENDALDYSATKQGVERSLLYKQPEGRALSALALLGDRESWAIIGQDTLSENINIRVNALYHLEEIGTPEAIPYLARYLEEKMDIAMRVIPTLKAIEVIGGILGDDAPLQFKIEDESADWNNVVDVYKDWWKLKEQDWNLVVSRGLVVDGTVLGKDRTLKLLREKMDLSKTPSDIIMVESLVKIMKERWPDIKFRRCTFNGRQNVRMRLRKSEVSLLEVAALLGGVGGAEVRYDGQMHILYAVEDNSIEIDLVKE